MPAEVTWQIIGFSFLPLALGVAALFVALRLGKGRRWRFVPFIAGVLLLCYWAVMVFTAAYPTIVQTDEGTYKCYGPGGVERECPPNWPPTGERYEETDDGLLSETEWL